MKNRKKQWEGSNYCEEEENLLEFKIPNECLCCQQTAITFVSERIYHEARKKYKLWQMGQCQLGKL